MGVQHLRIGALHELRINAAAEALAAVEELAHNLNALARVFPAVFQGVQHICAALEGGGEVQLRIVDDVVYLIDHRPALNRQ